MQSLRRRSTVPRIVVILTATVLIIGGVGWYLDGLHGTPIQPTSSSQTTDLTPTSKQPVMVKIPNVTPFPALIEDYNRDDSLWHIVNKQQPLSDVNYRPAALTEAPVPAREDKSADERSIRTDIVEPTKALFAAAKSAGYDLIIGSGFRSSQLQNIYYSNYVANSGQAASRYLQRQTRL